MSLTYLKKAVKTPKTGEDQTRRIVAEMLDLIEQGGEAQVREYLQNLDHFYGNIVVTPDEIATAAAKVPTQLKEDIRFAHERVKAFALKQLESMQEFESEIAPGVTCGQRLIPMSTAGCYVPGGRYAHVASAVMSITTARVAGVEHVVACAPPKPGEGIHPAIMFTMDLCGSDTILALGGV